MKISEMIKELEHIKGHYGDIEAQLQDHPPLGEQVNGSMDFWIVPEEYDNDEVIVNIRDWPY